MPLGRLYRQKGNQVSGRSGEGKQVFTISITWRYAERRKPKKYWISSATEESESYRCIASTVCFTTKNCFLSPIKIFMLYIMRK